MKKISNSYSNFYFILLLIPFFLASCSSRRAKVPQPLPPPQPVPESTASPTTSGEAVPLSPPVESSPSVPPLEPPKTAEGPHIALVLGGAGVASFGTIGLLKRFHEEGIHVDFIVSTGWPTLFALATSFLKSMHDAEWFAMRLQEKDFYKAGMMSGNDGFSSHESLSSLIENTFKQRELGEGKIPVFISAANTEMGDSDIYERGDWRIPLLKTMSVPGIYRPYPNDKGTEWIQSLQGIDVDAALNRGTKYIVAVEMYEDYFKSLKAAGKDNSDKIFRKLYQSQLRRSISREMKQATLEGKIVLNVPSTDFSSKRLAIFAGYKEGARLAKIIRK